MTRDNHTSFEDVHDVRRVRRGIYKSVEEVRARVDSKERSWAIQKYIERPLLIHHRTWRTYGEGGEIMGDLTCGGRIDAADIDVDMICGYDRV